MQPKIAVNDVDTYLSLQPEDFRKALEKLRSIIKEVAPEAEERIVYQMPMFLYHGMLVAFAGAKQHCGFYPCSSHIVSQFSDELKNFSTSKGTIRFTPEQPVPTALIKKIVKIRMKENLEKQSKKITKKQ